MLLLVSGGVGLLLLGPRAPQPREPRPISRHERPRSARSLPQDPLSLATRPMVGILTPHVIELRARRNPPLPLENARVVSLQPPVPCGGQPSRLLPVRPWGPGAEARCRARSRSREGPRASTAQLWPAAVAARGVTSPSTREASVSTIGRDGRSSRPRDRSAPQRDCRSEHPAPRSRVRRQTGATERLSTSGSGRRPCWPAPCGRCRPCACRRRPAAAGRRAARGEALGHRLLAALAGELDEPADGQRAGAAGGHLDRHLVGGATDAARADLEHRRERLDPRLELLDRVLAACARRGSPARRRRSARRPTSCRRASPC